MALTLDQTLVRNILEHPAEYPWRMQSIGLLGLRLDDRREYRLHLWDPDACIGAPPVHDHPYGFTSTVIVGEIMNTRYTEDPHGVEHTRHRYRPGDEDGRRTDSVRLVGHQITYSAGERYDQGATELHSSRQAPGTVTLIRCSPVAERELTVCLPPGSPWVSGLARSATPDEVRRITANALQRFAAAA